eukprot:3731371-Rhodomonas_salina.2
MEVGKRQYRGRDSIPGYYERARESSKRIRRYKNDRSTTNGYIEEEEENFQIDSLVLEYGGTAAIQPLEGRAKTATGLGEQGQPTGCSAATRNPSRISSPHSRLRSTIGALRLRSEGENCILGG